MWEALSPILQDADALLCPTLAVPAVPLDHSPIDNSFSINGKPVAADFGWMLTYPFNMLSPLPVINVPSGFAGNGVPTGVQIVGKPYQESGIFEIAAAYEKAQPWLREISQRPVLKQTGE